MIRRVGLSLFFPVLLGAQTGRGTITGRITDPAGAAVPGASVTCTSSATQASLIVRSNRAGEYNLAGVEPASYRITVSAERFRRMLRGPVSVAASATVRLDFQLQIGEASEVIEVSAPVAQVDANSAVVATAVRNRLVDQLPLVVGGTMRSPFDLVSIAAETRGSGTGLSLGGGQAAAWDATLDGLSMTTSRPANASDLAFIAPSVEAITEFVVETNGFKAEYGQAGGAMTFV